MKLKVAKSLFRKYQMHTALNSVTPKQKITVELRWATKEC